MNESACIVKIGVMMWDSNVVKITKSQMFFTITYVTCSKLEFMNFFSS